MSAAPRHPDGIGYAGLRMTADEFSRLGETPDRYELIDGVVIMSPSPTPSHSEIINEIVYQLKAFARERLPLRVFAETDLRLDDALVYRPDLAAYRAERLPARTPRLDLPPDLIVEVLSPRTRALDLVTKRRDYDRFGVAEYWIIDPEVRQVRALRRDAQGGPFIETLVTSPSLAAGAIDGFVLDLGPVLALTERP